MTSFTPQFQLLQHSTPWIIIYLIDQAITVLSHPFWLVSEVPLRTLTNLIERCSNTSSIPHFSQVFTILIVGPLLHMTLQQFFIPIQSWLSKILHLLVLLTNGFHQCLFLLTLLKLCLLQIVLISVQCSLHDGFQSGRRCKFSLDIWRTIKENRVTTRAQLFQLTVRCTLGHFCLKVLM